MAGRHDTNQQQHRILGITQSPGYSRLSLISDKKDQAWIESLNGTLKAEWPHLLAITDPAVLRAELDRIQVEYNTVRLHSSIGYVTPDDEHSGRGDAIRAARRKGLHDAAQRRLAHHRQHRHNQKHNQRPDPHNEV